MIYRWTTILRASLPILTIGVGIEMFAGHLLQSGQNTLLLFPIFFITIPVINSVAGNIGSILGARLASGLHVGTIEVDFKDATLRENLMTAVFLGILTYFILAIGIYFMVSFLGVDVGIGPMEFVFIMVGSGAILICVIALASVLTALWTFKKGLDPDDMVAPVVTILGDTLGIAFLFVFIGVVLL